MHKVYIKLPLYIPHFVYRRLQNLNRLLRQTNLSGDRDIEWSFVSANLPEGTGNALDFGNGGGPLALIAAIKGYSTIALDINCVDWLYSHPLLQFKQGDILTTNFTLQSFDLIINCSTVEHVGITGRYNIKEECSDGDLEAMKRLRELLKPEGTMLLTIPVGLDAIFRPMTRIYGVVRLPKLLEGYQVLKEEYWIKNEENKWELSGREIALQFSAKAGSSDPLKNIYGLGCFVLKKNMTSMINYEIRLRND